MSNDTSPVVVNPALKHQQMPTVFDPMDPSLTSYNVALNSFDAPQQDRNQLSSPHSPPRIPATNNGHLFPQQAMQMFSIQLSPHSSSNPQIPQSQQLQQQQLGQIDLSTTLSLSDAPTTDGFPTPPQFEDLLNEYILSLSSKKRDKALIPQKRYDNIFAVLKDPKCTTIESAQFRFWAKKMFRLVMDNNGQGVVCHEGKPVAVREQLYEVLTSAHGQASHGGRDKTSAQVRRYYSWVPKELIARFVRNCPSCSLRRSPLTEYNIANNSRNLAYKAEQELRHSMYASSTSQSPQNLNKSQNTSLNNAIFPSSVDNLDLSSLGEDKDTALDPSLTDTAQQYLNSDSLIHGSLPETMNISDTMDLSPDIDEGGEETKKHQQLDILHKQTQELNDFLLQNHSQLSSSVSMLISEHNHNTSHENIQNVIKVDDTKDKSIVGVSSNTQDVNQPGFSNQLPRPLQDGKDADFLASSPLTDSASSFLPVFSNETTF